MSILAANSHILYRDQVHCRDQQQQQLWSSGGSCLSLLQRTSAGCSWFDCRNTDSKRISKRNLRVEAFWPDMTRPAAVEMVPIENCDQLDQILLQAQNLSRPIVIDWYISLSLIYDL